MSEQYKNKYFRKEPRKLKHEFPNLTKWAHIHNKIHGEGKKVLRQQQNKYQLCAEVTKALTLEKLPY